MVTLSGSAMAAVLVARLAAGCSVTAKAPCREAGAPAVGQDANPVKLPAGLASCPTAPGCGGGRRSRHGEIPAVLLLPRAPSGYNDATRFPGQGSRNYPQTRQEGSTMPARLI